MPDDPEVTCEWGSAAAEDLAKAKKEHPDCLCSITASGHISIIHPGALEMIANGYFERTRDPRIKWCSLA